MKKASINGPFSMAILNNHRVCIYIYVCILVGGLEHFFVFPYIGKNNPN